MSRRDSAHPQDQGKPAQTDRDLRLKFKPKARQKRLALPQAPEGWWDASGYWVTVEPVPLTGTGYLWHPLQADSLSGSFACFGQRLPRRRGPPWLRWRGRASEFFRPAPYPLTDLSCVW